MSYTRGENLNLDLVTALEALVDSKSLLDVLTALELMCDQKAMHIEENWQPLTAHSKRVIKDWRKASTILYKAAFAVAKLDNV